MKVLRLFAIRSYDHRYAILKTGNESRYKREDITRDFPPETLPGDAENRMHDELGWPPELADYKYPPEQFVRITHHTICDNAPELGKIEEVRATEMDLFAGDQMKAALQDSPRLQAKRKK